MKRKLFSFALVAAASVFMLASCNEKKTESTETTMAADTSAMTTPAATTPMEQGVMVGGANMVPSKNIVENAAGSSDHTTLVAAVKQADLAATLSGAGPFTVFAPTNEAFDAIPKATLESLMTPAKKADLTKIQVLIKQQILKMV